MTRCLVVDDSRVIRSLARRMLESLSFEVDEAEDGADALARCGEALPDAVLLDWNMPRMTGIEFLREMRQLDGGDKPVVVFCTTENDISRISEALEAGANEYVMKPFDETVLASKFQQAGLL